MNTNAIKSSENLEGKLKKSTDRKIKLTSREKILNACRKIYVRDRVSYPKITISEICEVAGIGRKTFYRYFESKEDVFLRLVEHDVHGFDLIVSNIIARDIAPIEKIELLFAQFIKTYSEDFTADFIDEMRSHCEPSVWEYNARKLAEVLQKFSRVIQDGIEDGSIRSDVNPDYVLYVINSTTYAIRNKSISIESAPLPVDIMDGVYKIILNGIIKH